MPNNLDCQNLEKGLLTVPKHSRMKGSPLGTLFRYPVTYQTSMGSMLFALCLATWTMVIPPARFELPQKSSFVAFLASMIFLF